MGEGVCHCSPECHTTCCGHNCWEGRTPRTCHICWSCTVHGLAGSTRKAQTRCKQNYPGKSLRLPRDRVDTYNPAESFSLGEGGLDSAGGERGEDSQEEHLEVVGAGCDLSALSPQSPPLRRVRGGRFKALLPPCRVFPTMSLVMLCDLHRCPWSLRCGENEASRWRLTFVTRS